MGPTSHAFNHLGKVAELALSLPVRGYGFQSCTRMLRSLLSHKHGVRQPWGARMSLGKENVGSAEVKDLRGA